MRERLILVSFILLVFSYTNLLSEENFYLINEATNEVVLEIGPNVNERTTPFSTFKIALSLMGYDSGILKDKETPTWSFKEGYVDYIDSWKASQNPQSWMKNSCVWYSQILASQIGLEKVQSYLQLLFYGNQDMSGGITKAWLSSSLKISPKEQCDFIKKMIRGEMPVSSNAIQMTKSLLFLDELPGGWKLFGKTGLGNDANLEIGWFVGWIERDEDLFVFSYNVRDVKVDPSLRIPRVKLLLSKYNLHQEETMRNDTKLSTSIEITPEESLLDQDTTIVIKNLNSNEVISIKAEVIDDNNIHWGSWGSFQSDENGVIDLSTQSPLDGSYSGINPMGLLWSMQSKVGPSASFTVKKDQFSIVLKVYRDKQEIASKKIDRLRKTPEVKKISIRENGLVGTLFLPPSEKPLPVIISLSGSGGGIKEDRSQLLASHGFAVFALGYFGMEGLPPNLQDFPLEYFETAFKWIKSQPNLDGSHIGIYGGSRGGELVLILGSWFPESVQAIVAVVPSSVINSGEGESNNVFSHAWSFRGKPLAASFATQVQINSGEEISVVQSFLDGTGEDIDHPATILRSFLEGMKDKESFNAAIIPVEKIQAPVMLISGGDDQMWPSAFYSFQIEERLRKYHSSISCEHLHYPKAGHMIDMPYIPQPISFLYHSYYKIWFSVGGSMAENQYACQDSWKKIIAFFEKCLKPKQNHE